jgi:hypothetical protein
VQAGEMDLLPCSFSGRSILPIGPRFPMIFKRTEEEVELAELQASMPGSKAA